MRKLLYTSGVGLILLTTAAIAHPGQDSQISALWQSQHRQDANLEGLVEVLTVFKKRIDTLESKVETLEKKNKELEEKLKNSGG